MPELGLIWRRVYRRDESTEEQKIEYILMYYSRREGTEGERSYSYSQVLQLVRCYSYSQVLQSRNLAHIQCTHEC